MRAICRQRRWFTVPAIAGAVAVVLSLGVATSAPAATHAARALEATVTLTVKTQNTTIFSGEIPALPGLVSTRSGGTHLCDGLNNSANPLPGATPTNALNEASLLGGFTFDGTWSPDYDDFYITQIGSYQQYTDHFWLLFINGEISPVGGCQYELKSGDNVVWEYVPTDG